jgi:hypothetical protein
LALQAVNGQLKGNEIVIQGANGLLMAGGFKR